MKNVVLILDKDGNMIGFGSSDIAAEIDQRRLKAGEVVSLFSYPPIHSAGNRPLTGQDFADVCFTRVDLYYHPIEMFEAENEYPPIVRYQVGVARALVWAGDPNSGDLWGVRGLVQVSPAMLRESYRWPITKNHSAPCEPPPSKNTTSTRWYSRFWRHLKSMAFGASSKTA